MAAGLVEDRRELVARGIERRARHALDGSNGLGSLPVLQFFADGLAIGSNLTVQGPAAVGWQQLSFRYTPSAASGVLSIRDLTPDAAYNDFALDDISVMRAAVSTVPEPASWALMIFGFGAVGAATRTRRRVAALI